MATQMPKPICHLVATSSSFLSPNALGFLVEFSTARTSFRVVVTSSLLISSSSFGVFLAFSPVEGLSTVSFGVLSVDKTVVGEVTVSGERLTI